MPVIGRASAAAVLPPSVGSFDAATLAASTSWADVSSAADAWTPARVGDWLETVLELDVAAAATATVYSDNFDRSAGTNAFGSPQIGNGYAYQGTCNLNGTEAVCTSAGGDNYWVTDLGFTEYEASFTLGASIGADCGILVRYIDDSNLVLVHLPAKLIYTKASGSYDGGTAYTNVTWATGDVVKVVVTNASVKVYRQAGGAGAFTLLGTKTSSVGYTGTKIGARSNGSLLHIAAASATVVPNLLATDQTYVDVVTLDGSNAPVRSVPNAATAPTGASGAGAMSLPSARYTGQVTALYQATAGDIVNGQVKVRGRHRSPVPLGRTVTRGRLSLRNLTQSISLGGALGLFPAGIDQDPLHATYGDEFTGTTLAAKWTRRNTSSGDETWRTHPIRGGLRIGALTAGDFYFQTAPSGDFSIVLSSSVVAASGTAACGPCIVDSSGAGVIVTPYISTNGLVLWSMSAYGLGAAQQTKFPTFTAPMIYNGQPVWLQLRKVGTAYSARFSMDGDHWSAWTSTYTNAFTVDRIGFGCFVGGGADDSLAVSRFNVV